MSDPFRRLFLDHFELSLQREPSRDSLLALLQLATPGLASLGSTSETEKTFKTLMVRVHPDKHPQDTPRATRLCQDARSFYDKCLASSPSSNGKTNRDASSPTSVSFPFPLEFNVINKWPHIEYHEPYTKPELAEEEMSRAVAYQCINSRGAIAHGRKIENNFSNKSVYATKLFKSVEQIFSSFGGAKELYGANEIKEELTKNGPVVSTSFRPSDKFLSNHAIGQSNHCHQSDMLIVGWQQLSNGEVWIVQPLYHNGGLLSQVAYVAVGQFGLDECCLALKSNLEDTSWQRGPYFDTDLIGVEEEWRTWTGLNVSLDSMSQLDSLFKEIGTTFFANSLHTHAVAVRNKLKKAHSRRASLHSAKWNEVTNKFDVWFAFIE